MMGPLKEDKLTWVQYLLGAKVVVVPLEIWFQYALSFNQVNYGLSASPYKKNSTG